MKTILLIDDDRSYRHICAEVLEGAGNLVWQADTPSDAFPMLMEQEFDLILCDLHMPFTNGADRKDFKVSFEVGVKTVNEIRWALPEAKIAVLSAAAPDDLRRISRFFDPIPAFSKPARINDLLFIVATMLSTEGELRVQ